MTREEFIDKMGLKEPYEIKGKTLFGLDDKGICEIKVRESEIDIYSTNSLLATFPFEDIYGAGGNSNRIVVKDGEGTNVITIFEGD